MDAYVKFAQKAPWMVDLLNVNLGVEQEPAAQLRTRGFLERFSSEGIRITENLDFSSG